MSVNEVFMVGLVGGGRMGQTHIRALRGSPTVRVVAVEGIRLEVEPEAGGARDYRDRSGSH